MFPEAKIMCDKSHQIRSEIGMSCTGERNVMFGKSLLDIWIDKYGETEALNMWNKKYSHIPYFKTYPYKKYMFRSSWELKRAEFLDSHNVEWTYEEKTYKLSTGTYTPDFHIYENGKLIRIEEIKGWITMDFKRKFPNFCELYPELAKITKILLQQDLYESWLNDKERVVFL